MTDLDTMCAEWQRKLEPLLGVDAATADFDAAWEALQSESASIHSGAGVEALLLIAHRWYLANAALRALAPAQLAVECARRIGDERLLRKALTFVGVMKKEGGDLPGAVEAHVNALGLAQRVDPEAEAPVWNNLGVAFQNAAQYADALRCFQRAESIASASNSQRNVEFQALANIASCALQLQNLKAGVGAARRAIELNRAPTTTSDTLARVLAESTYARLLLEIGAFDEAAAHCGAAREYAVRMPNPRAEHIAAVTTGLVDVHAGRKDVGLTRLKNALENARKRVRAEIPDGLAACVSGYEAAGQPDIALVYLHELLAFNREAAASKLALLHQQAESTVEAAVPEIDRAMAHRRGKLRGQLSECDLLRKRIVLLEQQSVAAELHDDNTGEHCYRVGRLGSILAKEIGLEDDVCSLIDLAARLHDIGKLVVPDAILLKPGKLTAGERAIMETHTTAGAELLTKSGLPQMHIAQEIALHHHERWDGTGYPSRLAGTAIPIAARVTAIADVFDALTHVRPYKEAWSVPDALAEIRAQSGRHFDPELTRAFLKLVPKLQHRHGDLDAFLGVEAKTSTFIQARRTIAAALKGTDPSVSLFEVRR